MVTINTSNVSTNGTQTSFSGLSSGIDSKAMVDAIMAAKRASAVRDENKIKANSDKMKAYGDLKGFATTFRTTLDKLRGAGGLSSNNIFDLKQVYLSSAATAGAPVGHTVSTATDVMGVTVSSEAITGSHSVEVRALAQSQQIRSDAFTSTTTDLSTLGYTMGSFQVNGKTVSLAAGDSLVDLRDKINAMNTGSTPSNVSASIVSVSATESYLVLTSSKTGTANPITFDVAGEAVHNGLGFTQAATTTVKTQIQAAADAVIRVDGLGVDITRSSNVINDVIQGVTFDLYKAEQDTAITVDIKPDLNTIKSTVGDFIEGYNKLRSYVQDQRAQVARDGATEPTFGVLAFDPLLRDVDAKLREFVSMKVDGGQDGYQSLAQVGVTINSDYTLKMDEATFDTSVTADPNAMRKLFAFDASASDSRVAILGHTAQTSYSVSGGLPVPYYLNIAGTDGTGAVTDANLKTAAGGGTVGDSTITKAGNVLTVSSTSAADGLKILFNGGLNAAAATDIQITFTRGVADKLFTFFDDVTKTSGLIDTQVSTMTTQNTDLKKRVETIDVRLAIQRKSLEARMLKMETAMSQLNALRDQLTQQSNVSNKSNN